jgi:hypothetical protein
MNEPIDILSALVSRRTPGASPGEFPQLFHEWRGQASRRYG